VYALDITNAGASESSPGTKVLWEFNNTSTGGANLGYTYGRPNIGRLSNGKWVVLVPGGYFPTTNPAVDCTATPADPVCNNFSSLFVLDAQTGALIKELKTPTSVSGITGAVVSSGLSTPVLGDYQGDQIDDVAFAGDLQGDIWRFDLSDSDSNNWKTELFFRSSNPGDRPVTVMPRLFADPIGGGLVVVFGTGKYLASADNVIDSNTKQQVVYGIRDSGQAGQAVVVEGSTDTPLIAQTMIEKDTIRGLTTNAVPAMTSDGKTAIRGWYFNLYVNDGTSQTDKGERVVVDATALSDTNRAVITTLIPQDNDPCDPAPRGAVLFVDAATGGAAQGVDFGTVAGWPGGSTQAGALVKNPPTGGFLPVASAVGGGQIYLPGLTLQGGSQAGQTPSAGAPIWRRRSWRVLNSDQ
jgi:type IV pilus assembly protein PilY1